MAMNLESQLAALLKQVSQCCCHCPEAIVENAEPQPDYFLQLCELLDELGTEIDQDQALREFESLISDGVVRTATLPPSSDTVFSVRGGVSRDGELADYCPCCAEQVRVELSVRELIRRSCRETAPESLRVRITQTYRSYHQY
ncbi:MAG: hypothetical protein SPG61_04915 [Arcanobacterium sp.]|nr:hypothetical protein [Arcanobacterium sp.]